MKTETQSLMLNPSRSQYDLSLRPSCPGVIIWGLPVCEPESICTPSHGVTPTNIQQSTLVGGCYPCQFGGGIWQFIFDPHPYFILYAIEYVLLR